MISDEQVWRKYMREPDSAAAVIKLRDQLIRGDSFGRARATSELWDFASHRETAAIKRYLKAVLAGTESPKEPTS